LFGVRKLNPAQTERPWAMYRMQQIKRVLIIMTRQRELSPLLIEQCSGPRTNVTSWKWIEEHTLIAAK